MKSRRWIAAAALAAAVVFLVMVTGEHGPAAPNAAPAPVASSEAVLASDGGPSADDGAAGEDRGAVIDALKGLIDALGVSAEDLADGGNGADCGDGGQAQSNSGNGNGNNRSGNGNSNGAGCAQSGPGAADAAGSATITIAGFAFGQPLTVSPGATIEVVNTDAAPHNVTADDGSFKTPNLNQDETATFKAPTAPGRYQFTCTLHPEMTGTLIVEGSAAGGSAGDQGRTRSSEPTESQRSGSGSGSSSGDHNGARPQHQTTAPGRESTGGSSNGY